MKKRLTALVLCVLLILPVLPVAQASFDDISDPEVSLAATNLHGLGIVAGTSANNFTPNNSLTRAEACALIINTMGLSNQVNTYKQRTVFSDVLPSSWYTGIVNLAYAQGIVNGYGNGTFGPDDKVTYGHFATMLLRLLGYSSAEIGSVWPLDYTAFCDNLDLSEGLNLKPTQALTRAQAAVLLYRTLNTNANKSDKPYYTALSSVKSTGRAILLNNNVSYGGTDNMLLVYELENTAGLNYYEQTTQMEQVLIGNVVTLLMNDRGDVMAAVPESTQTRDVTISSAKASGITDADGVVHRINAKAVTIVGDTSYTWSSSGYIQVNSRVGQTARLFYEDGVVTYVCVTAGAADSNARVAVAQTNTPVNELVRKLSISGSYSITKNGAAASANDLARNDVAYFDEISKTLCVSDYQLTGYIQAAEPSLDAAESVTVAGCTVPVLEAAWDELENHKLGDRVTLLLTDDCKVAAILPDDQTGQNMVGLLNADGRTVTLIGSGLKITANNVTAEDTLRGNLVKVLVGEKQISCIGYNGDGKSGTLELKERTLGNYKLAPSCVIYERGSSKTSNSYLYSLAGVQGEASVNFDEVFWTDTLSSSHVVSVRLNSAGQIDLLVLRDVTGNYYEYGKLTLHKYTRSDEKTGKPSQGDGIVVGTRDTGKGRENIYSDAVTLTNAAGQTKKYQYNLLGSSVYTTYYGIRLYDSGSYQQVVEQVELKASRSVDSSIFFQQDDAWYAVVENYEIPVSEKAQVLFERTNQWLSGEEAIRAALANGTKIDVHYDRTFTTGAQVRVIVVKEA